MKYRKILFVITLLSLLCCCKQEEDFDVSAMSDKSIAATGVTLGRRLVNAYSTKNMRLAYISLYGSAGVSAITTTHLYGRILSDSLSVEQINNLLEDTTIDVYPYPLDYEIVGSGEYTPYPSTPMYLYMVSPIGWPVEKYPYKLIDSCCIPDDNDDELQAVEKESLRLTGNTVADSIPPHHAQLGSRVAGSPSGYIKVYNTLTHQNEGVRNVKIKMNTLVRVRNEYTDSTGFYSCATRFYTNVCYTIFYANRAGFKLWRNNLNILPHTMCLGVHHPNGYSYNMSTNSYGWYGATVNNAEDIFINSLCNDLSLPQPIRNLRIMLLGSSNFGNASTPMFYHRHYVDPAYVNQFGSNSMVQTCTNILPDMFIAGNPMETDILYNTVFHESLHALHYSNAGDDYWFRLIIGSILMGNSYGNPNSLYAGYIGVAEMLAYYGDSVLSDYYWTNYKGIDDSTITLLFADEWFRPDLLDSISQDIPSLQLGDIFYLADSNVCSHCNLTMAMVHQVNFAQRMRVRQIMSPVCPL